MQKLQKITHLLAKNIKLQKILSIINYLIPKDRHRLCIISPWDSNGNCYVFYNFLNEHNPMGFKVHFIKNFSNFGDIWNYFRSKVILSSHGFNYAKSKNQILIHTSHGIPFKSTCLLHKKCKEPYSKYIDYQISNSEFTSAIYSQIFNLSPERIIETGEPLMDFLMNPDKYYATHELKEKEFLKLKRNEFKKIVMYAPTFRDEFLDEFPGAPFEEILSDFFNIVEQNQNNFFIICPHPRDLEKNIISFEKYMHLNNWELAKIPSEKYLSLVDTVILDISSFFYNALYLEKNIIFFFPDYQKYINNTGSIYKNFEIVPDEILFKKYSPNIDKILESYPKETKTKLLYLKDIVYGKRDYSNVNLNLYEFISQIIKT